MALITSSTTDSMDDVKAAAKEFGYSEVDQEETTTVGTQDESTDKVEESASSIDDDGQGKTDADSETASGQVPAKKDEKEESNRRVERRIDRLTWEREEEKRRADRLEAELAELKAKSGNKFEIKPEPGKDEVGPRPKRGDFESDADYEAAVDSWYDKKADATVKKRIAEENERQRQAQLEQAGQELIQAWNTSVEEAKTRYDDWDEAVDSLKEDDIELPSHIVEAMISSELGTDLCYYLCKHKDEAEELINLPPMAAVRKLGKIEAGLKPAEKKAKAGEPAQKKKPVAVSSAPEPIQTVGGSGKAGVKKPEDMSPAEYQKWRREGGGRN